MGTVANALNMMYILRDGGTHKIRELAEQLEVSPKSIRVYREALDGAGIYVLEKRGKYGGYYLPKDFQNALMGLGVTEEEKLALEIVEGELKSAGHVEANQISALLLKMRLLDEKMHKEHQAPLEKISHIAGGSRPNMDVQKERAKLVQAVKAKREKKKLSLVYRSLSQEEQQRVLHIYSTYTFRGEIYVVAYCELRKEVRDFKLRRAHSLVLLEENFVIPSDFSLDDYLKNCIGIFKGESLDVRLKVKEPLAQIVRETIYSEEQRIEELPDENAILFEAVMRGKEEIIAWILSMGSNAEVLAPTSLKKAILDEVKGIGGLYEKT